MTAKILTVLAILSIIATGPVSATTLTVDSAGAGDYTEIQNALESISEGDTILVYPGTYTGPGNRFLSFSGTDAVLMSRGGPDSTVIDCEDEDPGVFFQGGETSECVVDGFTVTNGFSTVGGAMYFSNASPTIRNCIIAGNTADDSDNGRGGGIYCTTGANPTFFECTFSGNHADWGGGAGCEEGAAPTFNDCVFSSNTSNWGGGGMWLDASSSPSLTGCSFETNSVLSEYGDGGAMYIDYDCSPMFVDCSFTDNSAPGYGGALTAENSSPVFTMCTFAWNAGNYAGAAYVYGEGADATFSTCLFYNNTAAYEAGAVFVEDAAAPSFTDCTFAENTASSAGGAIYSYSYVVPSLDGCTFYANSAPLASGIWCDDTFPMTNCIIAFGVAGEAVYCDSDPPHPSCTDIYGNAGGDWTGALAGMDLVDNNLNEDPLFCDALNGDYSIDFASPCTAANSPACGYIGAWDIGCDTPVKAESWGAIKAMYR